MSIERMMHGYIMLVATKANLSVLLAHELYLPYFHRWASCPRMLHVGDISLTPAE